jgi:hypothetical protein
MDHLRGLGFGALEFCSGCRALVIPPLAVGEEREPRRKHSKRAPGPEEPEGGKSGHDDQNGPQPPRQQREQPFDHAGTFAVSVASFAATAF